VTLAELLRWLDREDVLLTVKGDRLKWSAPRPPPDDLREEILRHRNALLDLLRDPPAWPPVRGRSGPLGSWPGVVGGVVHLLDGREGTLRALEYDTRSGRLRCCVETSVGRRELLDPEDLILPQAIAAG
jgi:TubC N-terminal docking domain